MERSVLGNSEPEIRPDTALRKPFELTQMEIRRLNIASLFLVISTRTLIHLIKNMKTYIHVQRCVSCVVSTFQSNVYQSYIITFRAIFAFVRCTMFHDTRDKPELSPGCIHRHISTH